MRLFLDTNVVIDVISGRMPFYDDSASILDLCETGKAEGIVSALTFCTISYVLRKFLPAPAMREKIRDLRHILEPMDLSASILDKSLASPISDFEDAVQFFTAVYAEADFIVTRNPRHFPQAEIPVLTPTALLARMDLKE